MQILNMTMNTATKEQLEDGVVNLVGSDHLKVVQLFTFKTIKDTKYKEMYQRAVSLVQVCNKHECNQILVDGPNFFMPALTQVMNAHQIGVYFSYKEPVEVPISLEHGGTRNTIVRKHTGFVVG